MIQRFMVSVIVMVMAGVAASAGLAKSGPAPAKNLAVSAGKSAPNDIKPTLANVPYGKHPKQVMDFYKAESTTPTPLMFFIHGGGWTAGSKMKVSGLNECLAAGISVVSVEYRFVNEADKEGIKPPVKAPLEDAARALQFVRIKAAEWNIDKTRIGASGGSAGACSSLWLAFHDDMADPKSADPVARQSTRLFCAAVIVPQTSLDPEQMKEWTPNSTYGGHAFGINGFNKFLAARKQILPWIKEYSPYEWVSADDPPIYMVFNAPPALGKPQKDPTHTANFGVKLQEKIKSVGGQCQLVYPGAPDVKHKTAAEYLIATLKSGAASPRR